MSTDSSSGSAAGRGSQRMTLYLVYVLVVLYAVCYQLQSPLEPFLVDRLVGKDRSSEATLSYGRLQSFFMVIQAIGSLTFGNFIDRFGCRMGFLVNFVACAASYGLLANTSSLEMLYLSKVPGVAMAGFLCAQTTVSQLTDPGEERVVALGRLTTAYTIGGVFGPYAGGWLGSQGDYFVSAKIAVIGSILAAGLVTFLPAGTGEHHAGDASPAAQSGPRAPWTARARTVWGLAGFLIVAKLVTSTANSMSSSTQSVILKNDLGFSEADLGFFMSCQFAFGGFANGFLLAPVTKLMGGNSRTIVRNCVSIMAFGYFGQAILRSRTIGMLDSFPEAVQTYSFVGVAMFLSVFQYSLSTSITAESTRVVPEDMKGALIGMEHSIFAAARILTPAIGIGILNAAGVSTLYMTVGTIFAAVLVAWASLAGKYLPGHRKGN